MRYSPIVLILLIIGLLASCVSGEDTVEPGTLRIVVEGLPDGLEANIRIIGSVNERVETSGTIAADPGEYTIIVQPVSTQTMGYAPLDSLFTITIPEDEGVVVVVVYEPIEPIASSQSRPLPDSTADLLVERN